MTYVYLIVKHKMGAMKKMQFPKGKGLSVSVMKSVKGSGPLANYFCSSDYSCTRSMAICRANCPAPVSYIAGVRYYNPVSNNFF